MIKEKQSFVFFGSGPVAAASLQLLAKNFSIEAVITKPSTKFEMSVAAGTTVPIHCVQTKTELDQLFSNLSFTSELGVLIDFGIIVSQKIISYFPFGIINSHFSLLPELRGADPISFALLEGKKKTGVSLMLLVEAMDEGPILTIGEQTLHGRETTPELTDLLVVLSDALLRDMIPKYISGEVQPTPQSVIESTFNRTPSYTRKLTKQDGNIDWNKSAERIEREIRAYAGWPKSRANFNGIDCIITKASVVNNSGVAGTMFIQNKKLGVYCGHNAVQIDMITPSGKKEMDSVGFLSGYRSRLRID